MKMQDFNRSMVGVFSFGDVVGYKKMKGYIKKIEAYNKRHGRGVKK